MRISTLAFAGLFGGLLLVSDASACHKKKACTCAPAPVACAPAPVVACAPAPVACAPKTKHHIKMPKMTLGHHKKAATCAAPVTYAAAPAVYPTSQAYPTAQATNQGM